MQQINKVGHSNYSKGKKKKGKEKAIWLEIKKMHDSVKKGKGQENEKIGKSSIIHWTIRNKS